MLKGFFNIKEIYLFFSLINLPNIRFKQIMLFFLTYSHLIQMVIFIFSLTHSFDFAAKMSLFLTNVINSSFLYIFLSSLASYFCSNKRKGVGFGKTPDPEDSVSLQGDRTARNGQNGLSPIVCGPQCPGMTPPKNVMFSG